MDTIEVLNNSSESIEDRHARWHNNETEFLNDFLEILNYHLLSGIQKKDAILATCVTVAFPYVGRDCIEREELVKIALEIRSKVQQWAKLGAIEL